jgi:hypothetical protein
LVAPILEHQNTSGVSARTPTTGAPSTLVAAPSHTTSPTACNLSRAIYRATYHLANTWPIKGAKGSYAFALIHTTPLPIPAFQHSFTYFTPVLTKTANGSLQADEASFSLHLEYYASVNWFANLTLPSLFT